MKKFRFPLRSVETVRSLHELRAREAFTLAIQAHRVAETEWRQASAQRERYEQRLLAARQQAFRPAEQVTFFQAYQAELALERKAAEALARARTELDRQREHWVNARRDLRVIENLKAKARLNYRLEAEHEEQAILDDRTSAMVSRAPLLTS